MNTSPFSCIEVQSLTESNLQRVIAYCKRFGMHSIGYMAADWGKFQILDHSEWDVPPPDDEARVHTKAIQAAIRRASEIAADAGLGFYLWRREARLPVGFVDRYGTDWVRSENPEIWRFVSWNLEQIFQLFPKVSGVMLTCTGEQTPNEWISANGMAGDESLDVKFEKMFRAALAPCEKYGRDLILRTHGIANEAGSLRHDPSSYLENFLKAVGRLGRDVKVMGKSVEPDYQPGYPFNTILGRLADQQPTIMEFSLPMEYNGVSRIPFPMVEDIQFRMRYATDIGCVGVAARIDWHMSGHQAEWTWSCLDTPNEINGYAFGRLTNERGLTTDEIRNDYVIERYGEQAAPAMDAVYRDLYAAGMKLYYEFGHRSSYTPSGAFLPPWTAVTLLKGQQPHLWSHSATDFINNQRALMPDRQYIDALEAEKNEAEAVYRQALKRVDAAPLSPSDLNRWRESLGRVLNECAIRRLQCIAFYNWLAYENTGDEEYARLSEARLDEVGPLISAYSERYDAADLDPDAGKAFMYGANAQTTLEKQREALDSSRNYWKHCGITSLEKRRVCSHYEPNAYDLEALESVVRFNPALSRLQLLAGGDTSAVLFSGTPFLRLFMGGLLVDKRISYSGYRPYRNSNGELRLELFSGFRNLHLNFTVLSGKPALHLQIHIEKLPKDSELMLPWIPVGTGADDDAPFQKAVQIASESGMDITRKAVLAQPSVVVLDATPLGGSFASVEAGGGWAWKGEGTADVSVLLVW